MGNSNNFNDDPDYIESELKDTESEIIEDIEESSDNEYKEDNIELLGNTKEDNIHNRKRKRKEDEYDSMSDFIVPDDEEILSNIQNFNIGKSDPLDNLYTKKSNKKSNKKSGGKNRKAKSKANNRIHTIVEEIKDDNTEDNEVNALVSVLERYCTASGINLDGDGTFKSELDFMFKNKEHLSIKKRKLLDECKDKINNRHITINSLLDAYDYVAEEDLLSALEHYAVFKKLPALSSDYLYKRKQINKLIGHKTMTPEERVKYKSLLECTTVINSTDKLIKDILNSHYDNTVKSMLLTELKSTTGSHDESNVKKWINTALNVPNTIKPLPISNKSSKNVFNKFIVKAYDILDKEIYGMELVKKKIITDIITNVRNDNIGNKIVCLCGPPGTGKTAISKTIAKILGLDFIYIKMGGAADPVKLVGHSRTYVGSEPGEIVRNIKSFDHKNCVVYLDEIDKISKCRKGAALEAILIHMLDPEQNNEFIDEYLGFPIDLSKILWICSFNYEKAIDGVLADRMDILHVKGYSTKEKIIIAKKYLLPKIFKELSTNPKSIVFTDVVLEEAINIANEKSSTNYDDVMRELDSLSIDSNSSKYSSNNSTSSNDNKNTKQEKGVRQLHRTLLNVVKDLSSLADMKKNKVSIKNIKRILGYENDDIIKKFKTPFRLSTEDLRTVLHYEEKKHSIENEYARSMYL